jgi:hypothetical protein
MARVAAYTRNAASETLIHRHPPGGIAARRRGKDIGACRYAPTAGRIRSSCVRAAVSARSILRLSRAAKRHVRPDQADSACRAFIGCIAAGAKTKNIVSNTGRYQTDWRTAVVRVFTSVMAQLACASNADVTTVRRSDSVGQAPPGGPAFAPTIDRRPSAGACTPPNALAWPRPTMQTHRAFGLSRLAETEESSWRLCYCPAWRTLPIVVSSAILLVVVRRGCAILNFYRTCDGCWMERRRSRVRPDTVIRDTHLRELSESVTSFLEATDRPSGIDRLRVPR